MAILDARGSFVPNQFEPVPCCDAVTESVGYFGFSIKGFRKKCAEMGGR